MHISGEGPLLVGAPVHVHMLHMPKSGPVQHVIIMGFFTVDSAGFLRFGLVSLFPGQSFPPQNSSKSISTNVSLGFSNTGLSIVAEMMEPKMLAATIITTI